MKKTILAFCAIILTAALMLLAPVKTEARRTMMLGCEGDSQTMARSPLVDADTYCAKTAARLGYDHVNWATSGAKTADVVSRLPDELAGTHVDCLLVMIGANDAFIDPTTYVAYPPEWTGPKAPPVSGTSLADFQDGLVDIDTIADSEDVPWTYIAPWAFFTTANIVQFRFYVEGAEDILVPLGVPIVDAFHLQLDRFWNYGNNPSVFWNLYEVDYQHPSAAGHTLIANELAAERSALSCAH